MAARGKRIVNRMKSLQLHPALIQPKPTYQIFRIDGIIGLIGFRLPVMEPR